MTSNDRVKRQSSSKTCTCRHCGKIFLTRKYQPFCSATCKHDSGYKSQAAQLRESQQILEGANTNDPTDPKISR